MTIMDNPFCITFGIEPRENILRSNEFCEIIDTFNGGTNSTHTFIITGPRGCGKTSLLSSIEKELSRNNEWIIVDVNPIENIQEQIASALYEKGKTKHLFLKAEFDFSFKGIGFSIEGKEPVSDIMTLLEKMLAYLKKKDKKVLVCIDEISNTASVKSFAHAFQIFYRKEYPVYFLATGLYESVNVLENNETLTFLYRAPKIELKPLKISSIAESYSKIFKLSNGKSIELAKLTNGYAYAYQILGYLIWNNGGSFNEDILKKYDNLLRDRSYEKIWIDLPDKEKLILETLAYSSENTNREVMEKTGIPKNELSVYKSRLAKRGLIDTSSRGYSEFVLPRFKEFILNYLEF